MNPLTLTKTATRAKISKKRLILPDGAETTLHVAKYERQNTRPKVITLDPAAKLLDWCENNGHEDAISGGFFVRATGEPLGEVWINGQKQPSERFSDPWHDLRGCLSVDSTGNIDLAAFNNLPGPITGDVLQAGPLLIKEGISLVSHGADPEGFSATTEQFDSDITIERHPRAAIGIDKNYLWLAVCDGRSESEAGMYLHEFSNELGKLGVRDALNLDGGSSASLIANGQLLNHPQTTDEYFERGRPVHTAVILT